MPPAIIAGGVMAAGTIGGSILGAKAQSHAADQANAAQQQATAQQLELGRESLALNQNIYNSNYDLMSPWVSRGNVAGDSMSALLGLPAAPHMTSPMATTSGGNAGSNPLAANSYQGPSMAAISAMQNDGIPGNYGQAMASLSAWKSAHPGMDPFHPAPATPAPAAPATGTPAHPATPAITAPSAQQAMQNFANSAGMQFQLQQGSNTLNNMYAAHGQVQSGAAAKALQSYGQNTALNNYFMPYMNMLNGLSGQGASAGAAVAGAGQQFGNAAANINGQQSSFIQNGANSQMGNAAAQGAAKAGMWSGIGAGLGQLAGGISGMGGGMPSFSGLSSSYSMPVTPSAGAANWLPGGLY